MNVRSFNFLLTNRSGNGLKLRNGIEIQAGGKSPPGKRPLEGKKSREKTEGVRKNADGGGVGEELAR
jgi:hypothetical protein